MNKAIILLTKASSSEEAINKTFEYVRQFHDICNGDGLYDEVSLGGQWSGALTDFAYDPRLDPEFIVPCRFCQGTGFRNDNWGKKRREQNSTFTCDGCGVFETHPRVRIQEPDLDTLFDRLGSGPPDDFLSIRGTWKHGKYGAGRINTWDWGKPEIDAKPMTDAVALRVVMKALGKQGRDIPTSFSMDANIFDVDKELPVLPEDLTGCWAVVADFHS
jgi:hypothetical protein